MAPPVDDAVAVTDTAPPLTRDPPDGAVKEAVTTDAAPPVASGVVTTSNGLVPSVHASPIWLPPTVRLPVMKLRVCVPLLVPGTAAQAVQDVPLNFEKRIEFAASVLMTNSHTFVPSVAPN